MQSYFIAVVYRGHKINHRSTFVKKDIENVAELKHLGKKVTNKLRTD
jgi:hypothetical protein